MQPRALGGGQGAFFGVGLEPGGFPLPERPMNHAVFNARYCVCQHMYIYREREKDKHPPTYVNIYIYVYVCAK